MKNNINQCTASLGSVTAAMRAQNELAAASIPSTVIKTQSSRGCVYGISFPCPYEGYVRNILSASRISVRQWDHPS